MKKYTKEEITLTGDLDKYLIGEIRKIHPQFKRVSEKDYALLRTHIQAQTENCAQELENTTCNITYNLLRTAFLMKHFEIDPRNFDDVITQGYLFTKDFLNENGTNLPNNLRDYQKAVYGYIKHSFKEYNQERMAKNADLNYGHIEHNPDNIFSDRSGIAEKSHKPIDPQNLELVR